MMAVVARKQAAMAKLQVADARAAATRDAVCSLVFGKASMSLLGC